MDAVLRLDAVSKDFRLAQGKAVTAVDRVSFDVGRNRICVLLGPSGCGKSTVLRMIAGLEQPTRGKVLLNGAAVDGPGRDRGMVFQAYTSFDWLSVRRNVEFGMRINGVPAKERRDRAEHFIRLVGLSQFIEATPARR